MATRPRKFNDPVLDAAANRIVARAAAHKKQAQQRAAQRKAAAQKPVVPASKHLPIPGLEYLGAGYNVFGRYASPDDVKANIFDFTIDGTVDQQLYDESLPQVRDNVANAFIAIPTEIKLIYARPAGVQFKARFHADVEVSESGSMSDEQSALSAHAEIEGEYGLFSGELKARYSQSAERIATAKCYSVTAMSRYFDLSMANYALRPLKYIRPIVRQELNDPSITPAAIFDKYGTHYLYAVTIGTKIVYGHTFDTSKTTKSFDAGVEMQLKYGEPGAKVSGGGGVDVKGSTAQASDAESIKFYGDGVSDEQLKAAGTADKNPLGILVQGWHNPTLVDFPPGALKPIWELCDTDKRKGDLAGAFAKYKQGRASIVGGSADLVPLYLFRSTATPHTYRLAANRNDSGGDGTWTLDGDDDTPDPALFVYADGTHPNTVPLYAYRLSPGPSADLVFRYETSRWESYLTKAAKSVPAGIPWWTKVSGNPIGWVYDGLVAAPTGSQDVYAYVRHDAPGYLYSTDSADGRDGGAWQAAAGHDELGAATLGSAGDADIAAVLKLQSNVHWRAPTL